jgi:hypothetical protein
MDAGGGSSIKLATRRQAESSRGSGDREVDGKGTTVQGISVKRDNRIKVAKHGKTKNSIDSDVGAQGEGKSNRRAGVVNAWSAVSDHGGEVAVGGRVEIDILSVGTLSVFGRGIYCRIADGTA